MAYSGHLRGAMTSDAYGAVLTALAIWREARGQIREAKCGVYHVIATRAAKEKGGTVAAILKPYQFSSFNAGDPNAAAFPRPDKVTDWNAWLDCCDIVDNPGPDMTGGATHYHSYPEGHPNWPAWADRQFLKCRIGAFWFYKLRA